MPPVVSPPRTFDETVDVLVVGAGACGMTAAISARDAGADVLLLEADRRPAGSTAMSLGAACAVATAEQRRNGIEDSPDLFFADVMAKTGGLADRRLTRTIAAQSGPALDWLAERHDVPLPLDFAWRGLGHSQPRLHMPSGRSGPELLARLGSAVERVGASLLTEAKVDAIYSHGDGRALGVRIIRPGGNTEDVGCRALVIATCGFGGNRAMVAQHIHEMAHARYFGHEGNRGDGILWGAALGGELADLTAYQGLGTLAEPHAIIVPHPLLSEGGILVNALAERFTHEMANISGMCVPVLAQPGGIAWLVFDDARHRSALAHSPEQRELETIGALRRGDSIAALADACGLPAERLTHEIELTTLCRADGSADRFGRSFEATDALRPPWFAVKVTGALFHTQGGLVVDEDARICRGDGTTLPNVFAGGGAARSISGPDVTGYLPGAGLCMAITLGRLAGNAAAIVSHGSSID